MNFIDIILVLMTAIIAVFGVHAYRHQRRLERRWLKSYALIVDRFKLDSEQINQNFELSNAIVNQILEHLGIGHKIILEDKKNDNANTKIEENQ